MKWPVWLIVAFWLVTTGWLVRYEAFPEWFAGRRQSYRDFFDDGLFVLDSWMRISLNGQPAGYTHTWVDSDTSANRLSFQLRNQTALSISLAGQARSVAMNLGATLDDKYTLMDFYAAISVEGWRTRINGRRIAPERFEVTVHSPGVERTMDVAVPADAQLHTPLTEMMTGRLKPGQSMTLRVFNPMTLALEDMRVSATGRETLRVGGREYNATALTTHYQGMEMRSWVDAQGRAIRQETPWGLTMEVCTAAEATLPETPPAFDMPGFLGGFDGL